MSIFDLLSEPGIHEKQLTRQFGAGLHYVEDAPVFDVPLVCLAFSNRCGSNLLAGYLRDTPAFGGFHEQLNFDTVIKTCAAHGLRSFPDYILHLCEAPIEAGQIYGFKTSWDQLAMLFRCRIDRMFSGVHVIHMTRSDTIGQAISLMIADQTKQWTSAQAARSDVRPQYRPMQLRSLVQSSLLSEQIVRILCDAASLRRLHVTYEELVESPESVIADIASFLNTDLSGWTAGPPHIARQATKQNDVFRRRFLAELRQSLD
ncbi:Stf0 family sulfotransferase [Litoreibacter janthinus]|uniref:LPS sulfotransferase NodH n=1 Tax=Litoreibacter janthinus TaxID=670154 RepID=A0A1I6ID55_9RHOB|nr:Stf0 family sulfotransferase [Litoreibacter janthinus]SFR64549.1 LPS sulfotransferase NodH [Litoreibacter janthinus]